MDIGIAVVIIVAILFGYFRGFVDQIFSLLVIVGTLLLFRPLADHMATFIHIDRPLYVYGLSLLILFVGLSLVRSLIVSQVATFFGWLDRLLGALVGGLFMSLVFGTFMLFAESLHQGGYTSISFHDLYFYDPLTTLVRTIIPIDLFQQRETDAIALLL